MPVWERYDGSDSLGAVGAHVNTEVFQNVQGDENFESSEVVGVDGILTVVTDTDDLVGIRLLTLINNVATGDFDENDPKPNERSVWYSFFAARGPMVFRLRSKKTIYPGYKLWVNTWKAQGANTTILNWGFHVLWQVKH